MQVEFPVAEALPVEDSYRVHGYPGYHQYQMAAKVMLPLNLRVLTLLQPGLARSPNQSRYIQLQCLEHPLDSTHTCLVPDDRPP
mmetsp:Transcript_24852/g.45939  ORF Transcript_24852/g.45939 Transcript_24852/m.45939 type:complete len:84 (+) Transcript_24852:438-689(+)